MPAALVYAGAAAVAGTAIYGIYADMKTCEDCGARWPRVEFAAWNVTEPATTLSSGSQRRACRCKQCGWVGWQVSTIRRYDGVRYRNGRPYYYYYSDSGGSGPGSGGGGSSNGGGAGGSW